jgi:hypothetical protein
MEHITTPSDHGTLAHELTKLRDDERRTGRNHAVTIAAILRAWEAAR